jgi:hypothetical protein
MKIHLPSLALSCYHSWYVYFETVWSLPTGISARKKTLVPLKHEAPNLDTKQCIASIFHKTKSSTVLSLFNFNTFFDEKRIIHSGFSLSLCFASYHTHIYTHLYTHTYSLQHTNLHLCLKEGKKRCTYIFLYTASHKFSFWHTSCQCPWKLKSSKSW